MLLPSSSRSFSGSVLQTFLRKNYFRRFLLKLISRNDFPMTKNPKKLVKETAWRILEEITDEISKRISRRILSKIINEIMEGMPKEFPNKFPKEIKKKIPCNFQTFNPKKFPQVFTWYLSDESLNKYPEKFKKEIPDKLQTKTKKYPTKLPKEFNKKSMSKNLLK